MLPSWLHCLVSMGSPLPTIRSQPPAPCFQGDLEHSTLDLSPPSPTLTRQGSWLHSILEYIFRIHRLGMHINFGHFRARLNFKSYFFFIKSHRHVSSRKCYFNTLRIWKNKIFTISNKESQNYDLVQVLNTTIFLGLRKKRKTVKFINFVLIRWMEDYNQFLDSFRTEHR